MVTDAQLRSKILELRKANERLEKLKREREATRKLEKEFNDLKRANSKRSKFGKGLLKSGKFLFKAAALIGEDVDRVAKKMIMAKRIARERELEILRLKASRKRNSNMKKLSKRRKVTKRRRK